MEDLLWGTYAVLGLDGPLELLCGGMVVSECSSEERRGSRAAYLLGGGGFHLTSSGGLLGRHVCREDEEVSLLVDLCLDVSRCPCGEEKRRREEAGWREVFMWAAAAASEGSSRRKVREISNEEGTREILRWDEKERRGEGEYESG